MYTEEIFLSEERSGKKLHASFFNLSLSLFLSFLARLCDIFFETHHTESNNETTAELQRCNHQTYSAAFFPPGRCFCLSWWWTRFENNNGLAPTEEAITDFQI